MIEREFEYVLYKDSFSPILSLWFPNNIWSNYIKIWIFHSQCYDVTLFIAEEGERTSFDIYICYSFFIKMYSISESYISAYTPPTPNQSSLPTLQVKHYRYNKIPNTSPLSTSVTNEMLARTLKPLPTLFSYLLFLIWLVSNHALRNVLVEEYTIQNIR